MPVITLVLYFGTKKRWNAPLNIKGLMDIPEELEPFVSDYKINVFEIAWLSDEQVKMFKSDFRIVADYFVQMRKNQHYVPEEKTVKHVDEVLKLIHALTGDKRYEVVFSEKEKERGVSMCDVLTKIDENARAEGRAEERKDCALKSIKMLRKCGQSDAFIVEQLREEYGYSLEDCEELMRS